MKLALVVLSYSVFSILTACGTGFSSSEKSEQADAVRLFDQAASTTEVTSGESATTSASSCPVKDETLYSIENAAKKSDAEILQALKGKLQGVIDTSQDAGAIQAAKELLKLLENDAFRKITLNIVRNYHPPTCDENGNVTPGAALEVPQGPQAQMP